MNRQTGLRFLVFFEAFDETHGVDRLGDKFKLISLELPFLENVGNARLSREEQNGATGIILAERYSEFDAVHARHQHVRHDPVWMEPRGFVECVESIVGGDRIEASV